MTAENRLFERPSKEDRLAQIPNLDWRISDNKLLGQPEAGCLRERSFRIGLNDATVKIDGNCRKENSVQLEA